MYFPSINLFKNILLRHITLKQEAAKIWTCDYSIADSDIASGQLDSMIGDGSLQPFSVGRKIKVDKDGINIGRRRMNIRDIGRMRISEEGSMALYDRYGKKICGTFTVNYMMENIELLCWCLHHYGVEAEITSGKGERVYQYIVLAIVIAATIACKIFGII